jgi:hypothetical protein
MAPYMIVYAVDDEPFTVHIWYQLEAENIFPGVTYGGSYRFEDALDHAATTPVPTLYVFDSRVPMDTSFRRGLILEIQQAFGTDLTAFPQCDAVNGVLAGAAIKVRRPSAKVILLTAFAADVVSRLREPAFSRVAASAWDELLAKPCSERLLIETLRKYLEG